MADGSRFRKKRHRSNAVEDGLVMQAREVFELAANSIAERFSLDPHETLGALHIICKERDPQVLEPQPVVVSPAVQSIVDDTLLGLEVKFQFADTTSAERTVVLVVREGSRAVKQTVRSKASWDELPAEVREDRILNNTPTTSYRIYPSEEHND